jgi:hypothetical protein
MPASSLDLLRMRSSMSDTTSARKGKGVCRGVGWLDPVVATNRPIQTSDDQLVEVPVAELIRLTHSDIGI